MTTFNSITIYSVMNIEVLHKNHMGRQWLDITIKNTDGHEQEISLFPATDYPEDETIDILKKGLAQIRQPV